METFFESSCTINEKLVSESAIALGFFDGVHPGHQAVIQKALDDAKKLKIKAGVVTFKDHPRSLTRGKSPMLLTVIEKRLELIEKLGIDFAVVLSFTEELCRLSPEEYVENVLVGATGAKSITVGHNHHFGKDREGNAELLAAMGKNLDFTVNVAPMIKIEGSEVSSSRIREFIKEGKMHEAKLLLLRPFSICGLVAHGDGRGKEIGFPTANLEVFEYQMLPKRGVYAGIAHLKGNNSGKTSGCVVNVGLRPTFKNTENHEDRLLIEAHLFDQGQNLYGEDIEIEFLEYLREEEKFASKEALVSQIKRDKKKAVDYLNSLSDRFHIEEEKLHA